MLTMLATALLMATASQQAQQAQRAAQAEPVASGPLLHVQASRRRWDPQRVVCKDLDQPGSHLNVKRVCRSMLEWASDRREDQQLLIQKQYNGAP
jgi:hypothetical protein